MTRPKGYTRMRVSSSPGIAAAVVAAALVFASLAWIATSERNITLATKTGTVTSEGLAAVIRGFVFIGTAMALLGMFASASRWRNLIWLGIGLAWAAGTATYFLFFYG
jgi:hypothetical protein